MELLTEKTLVSISIPLGPGDAVRRIFETIAGGVILHSKSLISYLNSFFLEKALLKDPCEKENVNVLANIQDQEREDITSSAQHALRLIAFRQIYKILSIERIADLQPSSVDRKRTREPNSVEEGQFLKKNEG